MAQLVVFILSVPLWYLFTLINITRKRLFILCSHFAFHSLCVTVQVLILIFSEVGPVHQRNLRPYCGGYSTVSEGVEEWNWLLFRNARKELEVQERMVERLMEEKRKLKQDREDSWKTAKIYIFIYIHISLLYYYTCSYMCHRCTKHSTTFYLCVLEELVFETV